MARIDLAPEVGEDFERILAHLEEHESPRVSNVIESIIQAIDVLQTNPLIGRPTSSGNRELVIGSRRTGYVALYRYFEEIDQIVVLAVRSQKELGYGR